MTLTKYNSNARRRVTRKLVMLPQNCFHPPQKFEQEAQIKSSEARDRCTCIRFRNTAPSNVRMRATFERVHKYRIWWQCFLAYLCLLNEASKENTTNINRMQQC